MNLFRARPTPISLALQGGGAHGAFTWGVLDALLEDGRFPISAVSATSAGAMNAVAMAHGLCAGGRDAARAALEKFWLSVAASVSLDGLLPNRDTLFGVSAAAISKNASAVRQASGSSGACSRCAASAGDSSLPMPVGLTLAGLAWSLLRRNRRRGKPG